MNFMQAKELMLSIVVNREFNFKELNKNVEFILIGFILNPPQVNIQIMINY